jgi:serine protease Do
MTVEKNNPSFARENELKTSAVIVVTNVDRGGAAYENGLRAGDVILQVNRTEIISVDQFRKLMAAKDPGTSVLLYINRLGDETAVRFTVPER